MNFWCTTPCSLAEIYQIFGEICCFYLQDGKEKMMIADFSKPLVLFYQNTRLHNMVNSNH